MHSAYKIDQDDKEILPNTGTLVLPIRREQLFAYFPKGMKIAEIGVAKGKFSRRIKSLCKPEHLR